MSGIRPVTGRQLMTLDEFRRFIARAQTKLYVRQPYRIVPCTCGDLNCHGWRFVELRPDVAPVEPPAQSASV